EKKAREMVLTGEVIGADMARYYGLVNHIVSEEDLTKRAEDVFTTLRQFSAPALGETCRAFQEVLGLPFSEGLKRAEDIYLNKLMSRTDPVEGIEAFIAKRPPRWRHK